MAKKIISIAIALLLVWFLWWWYSRWKAGNALASGEVIVTEPVDRPRVEMKESPAAALPAFAQGSTQPIVYPPAQTSTTMSGSSMSGSGMGAATMPGADTISPNPPNGMAFAGTGRFEVYREGNLTWRINTDTGQACIIFATDEEWQKPKVYRHGCGSN